MIVFNAPDYVRDWVASELNQSGFAGNFITAFGNFSGNKLIGGVVFHNYYPNEGVVEMSAASIDPLWLSRKMIRSMFNYAFGVLGCQMVVLRVSENNSRMLNVAKRFGMNDYLIPRLRGRNEAEWVLTYTDDQWRDSPFNRSK